MQEERHEGENKIRKRKKTHKLYAAIVLVLGVIIICLSVLLLFYVQRIEIKGNQYCSDKTIVQAIQNDKFSINSLYVLAKYSAGNGEVPVGLESMEVKMKNPWTLSVTVEEKESIGYFEHKKQRVYFDEEGLVLIDGLAIVEGVPLVEGVEFKNIKLHSTLSCENSGVFEEIRTIKHEFEKNEIKIDHILYINDRIYVYKGKKCFSLGMEVTPEKVAQIPPILKKLGKKKGTLHLENYSGGNETITFAIGEFPKEN